jgi:hypothetical protein
MSKKSLSFWALLAIAFAVSQLGCSLILAAVGASSDSSKPKQTAIEGWQILTLKPGNSVDIWLRDGNKLSGEFEGLQPVPREQYAEAYARAQQTKPEGVLLPDLGSNIAVTRLQGIQLNYEIDGFDFGETIWLKAAGRAEASKESLMKIARIADSRGNAIEGTELRALMAKGQIPLKSKIAILTFDGETQLSLDQVYQIQVPTKKNSAVKGFLMGAAIDGFLVFLVVASLPWHMHWPD